MEGDLLRLRRPQRICISIHSLRMEGDRSRLPVPRRQIISIHSLRMEGDLAPFKRFLLWRYFNPLPPHGGRP